VAPATSIQPNSQVVLRFSEPMDPASVSPFSSFRVQTKTDPTPYEVIVGEVSSTGDLKEFTYTPVLPFRHENGAVEQYFVALTGGETGITDLAGNPPVGLPSSIEFTLNSAAPTVSNGGIALGFDSLDEVDYTTLGEDEWREWRGQFLYDSERDLYKARPLVRTSAVADRTQVVPGNMNPFAPGVQTPLSPLGSKLMTLWRYCDVGYSSTDEGNFNMDIEGLSWSPVGAQIVSDFYPEFEIRLSHSHYLPDEALDGGGLPMYQNSGLVPSSYNANILVDPVSPQKIVHPRHKGYVLNPVDLFKASTGTFMMPYPLNRSTPPAEDVYYTWRDTAIQKEAGPNGTGIDLHIMEVLGLIPAPVAPPPPGGPSPFEKGMLAMANQVPSFGLPLLMEFRTYPAEEGIGLNAFDISLAINTSRVPAFRIFSTGGLNSSGVVVPKDPDLEDVPTGGFNPSAGGASTWPDDSSFYIGQMDVITRISRMHSIWFDTLTTSDPQFEDPVVEPAPEDQPGGTQLILAYRGASLIEGKGIQFGLGYAFRADYIDPYGEVRDFKTSTNPDVITFVGDLPGVQYFPAADKTWKSDISQLNDATYFQMRVTFVGNTATLLTPEFSGVGVAWTITE
jgi:hypothetical protein